MAVHETKRLKPGILEADASALASLLTLRGYAPSNPRYKPYALKTARDAVRSLRAAEARAEVSRKAARDQAVAAEWAFHNLILGTKEQVVAQYGRDSDEVQALGLKKKSEYKPRKSR